MVVVVAQRGTELLLPVALPMPSAPAGGVRSRQPPKIFLTLYTLSHPAKLRFFMEKRKQALPPHIRELSRALFSL